MHSSACTSRDMEQTATTGNGGEHGLAVVHRAARYAVGHDLTGAGITTGGGRGGIGHFLRSTPASTTSTAPGDRGLFTRSARSTHCFTYIVHSIYRPSQLPVALFNGQYPLAARYVQYECYEATATQTARSETRKLARGRPARCPATWGIWP